MLKHKKQQEQAKHDLKHETLTSFTWKGANTRLWALRQWT